MKYLMIFLFVISFVGATALNYNCPSSVYLDEEFNCDVKVTDGAGLWDLKFEVLDGGKSIARIYDSSAEKYKSAFYYLKEYLRPDEETKFQVKITKEGSFNGKIKARRDGKIVVKEFEIWVEKKSSEKAAVEENLDKPKDDLDKKSDESKEKKEYVTIKKEVRSVQSDEEKREVGEIVLNSVVEEGANGTSELIYESKGARILSYSPYAFSIFLIVVIFFLIRNRW